MQKILHILVTIQIARNCTRICTGVARKGSPEPICGPGTGFVHRPEFNGEKLLCAVAPTFLHAQRLASRERKRGFVKEVTANFNIKEIEREVQAYWRTHDTYKAVRQHRSTGKAFFFVDGPPYTTGHIHIGTAWNKILKDSILRYHRMNGRNVIDRAGYDMHGLPIEVKVEQALGFKSKKDIEKFGMQEFIEKCREFATTNKKLMDEQFESLGVWLDFRRCVPDREA